MIKIFAFQISLFFSLLSNGQSYSDLRDQSYLGSVMQVTTKFFSAISLHNGKWHVNDSLQPGIVLIEHYNNEGNFIRKEVRTSFDTSLIEYNYSNKEKPVWIKKNNSGKITETATISQESPDIINEVITEVADSSITELIRFLDNRKRTKTLEEKGYDLKGKLVYHVINTNQDDLQGLFWKVKIETSLIPITFPFFFVIISVGFLYLSFFSNWYS